MTTANRILNMGVEDKHLRSDNTEEFQEDTNVLADENEGAFQEDNTQESDSTEDTEPVNKKATPDNEGDADVLPRFQGKSAADISRAYAELESTMGRLTNELGDYRKLARDYLFNDEQANSLNKDKKAKELTDEDFLEKPSTAVSTMVKGEIDPVLKRIEKVDANLRMAEFNRQNPDAKDIVLDPQFKEWVSSSPYRTKLFKQADAMDFDAANDLLAGYREVKASQSNKDKLNTKEADKKTNLRKVGSEKGASASSGKKKVWSSAYLINLKITNPEKYNALQNEILEAYNEGRVK